MGLVRNLALGVLALSFVVFVALFGRIPAFRRTPIGWLHQLLWIHIPEAARAADQLLTGGRIFAYAARLGHFLLFEKHPLVMIFFLGLLTSCAAAFVAAAWPLLTRTHKLTIAVLLAGPYFFTYKSTTSTASLITPENLDMHVRCYPYDYTLFHPGRVCRTCRLPKPARSKHCSICRACVARADHHCAWINNCVGRDNYRWFLGLLVSLSAILVYGAWLTQELLADSLRPALRRVVWTRPSSLSEALSPVLAANAGVAAPGLLALCTAPLALGLAAYHAYLVYGGTTTSETAKWGALREDMLDGCVWKGDRDAVFAAGVPSVLRDLGPRVDWPVESQQVVLRTADGEPPSFAELGRPGSTVEHGGPGHWERVWGLGDVVNVYDLGWVDNLREALLLL